MSLVAYDSSDNDSEEENIELIKNNSNENTDVILSHRTDARFTSESKNGTSITDIEQDNNLDQLNSEQTSQSVNFSKLPKPKNIIRKQENIGEDDDIPPKKETEIQITKTIKKDRTRVKITVPSLSTFKDLDEENGKKQNKIILPEKCSGLFSLLPPPKITEQKTTKPLIPHVLTKSMKSANPEIIKSLNDIKRSDPNIKKSKATTKQIPNITNYDSNSEDEDNTTINNNHESNMDFFALTSITSTSSTSSETAGSDYLSEVEKDNCTLKMDVITSNNKTVQTKASTTDTNSVNNNLTEDLQISKMQSVQDSDKTLVSNVMNLPKEEILLKNKAEIGPKLPIPEQEYNVDLEGNVAFDERAIEYLCGKRGIKRKEKELDEANIIEIKGDDIKPDEREWLVKALTEEPVQRPVSMQSSGVSSQSKKKHQITYLAHQAKAMEMELKNQWALNRMTRKQTQSKYGF